MSAEENLERFIEHADRYSLAPYQAVGIGVKAELFVKRGELEVGIHLLRGALETLHEHRYELLTTAFNITLAEGYALAGALELALNAIDETIAHVESNGDLLYMPELLRKKAEYLASKPRADLYEAEDCLSRSLELAGKQGALAWELRGATSLALFRSEQGRLDEAREVLARVYERFTEGLESCDLKVAKRILDDLADPDTRLD